MRWLFSSIVLIIGLVLMAFLGVMATVGVLMDLDALREEAYMGLTWGESILALLGMTSFAVVFSLVGRLHLYEKRKPEFEVTPANFLFTMRLKVINTSPSSVSVSARAEGFSKDFATEPFLLGWEETKKNQLLMNPGDHGTITIGVGKAIKQGVPGVEPYISHFVEMHGRNADGDAKFRFYEHLEHQNPGGYTLRLHLFPNQPSSIKKYTYDFDVHHEHPQQAFWLHPIPPPPNWWLRTIRRLGLGKSDGERALIP